MNFRTKAMSFIVALCILSFAGGFCIANAGEATKVIGKANIKKGTELGGMVILGQGVSTGFVFVAFEDTTLYLTEKVDPIEGEHSGGYLADASGFPHHCPTHGKEVMGAGVIGLPNDQINSENSGIEIILFEMSPKAGGTNG